PSRFEDSFPEGLPAPDPAVPTPPHILLHKSVALEQEPSRIACIRPARNKRKPRFPQGRVANISSSICSRLKRLFGVLVEQDNLQLPGRMLGLTEPFKQARSRRGRRDWNW